LCHRRMSQDWEDEEMGHRWSYASCPPSTSLSCFLSCGRRGRRWAPQHIRQWGASSQTIDNETLISISKNRRWNPNLQPPTMIYEREYLTFLHDLDGWICLVGTKIGGQVDRSGLKPRRSTTPNNRMWGGLFFPSFKDLYKDDLKVMEAILCSKVLVRSETCCHFSVEWLCELLPLCSPFLFMFSHMHMSESS
jgi:hypothetical protein